MRSFFSLSLLLIALVFGGCVDYRLDNPAVRSMQAASMVEVSGTPVRGESLKAYFGPRMGYLVPSENIKKLDDKRFKINYLDGSGRAAAVSEDGYYLTAYHVADRAVTLLEGPFGVKQFEGRMVKVWAGADLALVKFAFRPKKYFEKGCEHVGKGMVLYSASNQGMQVGKDKYGNGPFEVRGEVMGVKKMKGYQVVRSSMVARGGMSGSPVANEKGELVGILSLVNLRPFTHTFHSSEANMVSWVQIQRVIREDREKYGKGE